MLKFLRSLYAIEKKAGQKPKVDCERKIFLPFYIHIPVENERSVEIYVLVFTLKCHENQLISVFFFFEFEFEFEFDGKDARITSKRIENIIIIDTCKND